MRSRSSGSTRRLSHQERACPSFLSSARSSLSRSAVSSSCSSSGTSSFSGGMREDYTASDADTRIQGMPSVGKTAGGCGSAGGVFLSASDEDVEPPRREVDPGDGVGTPGTLLLAVATAGIHHPIQDLLGDFELREQTPDIVERDPGVIAITLVVDPELAAPIVDPDVGRVLPDLTGLHRRFESAFGRSRVGAHPERMRAMTVAI